MGKQEVRRISTVRFPKGYAVDLDQLMADIWKPGSNAYDRHKGYLELFWAELCKVRTKRNNVTIAKYATAEIVSVGKQTLNDTIRPLVEHLDDMMPKPAPTSVVQRPLPVPETSDRSPVSFKGLTEMQKDITFIVGTVKTIQQRQRELAQALRTGDFERLTWALGPPPVDDDII